MEALGYTHENLDAISEMEKRTSVLERGKSVYEPPFKRGY